MAVILSDYHTRLEFPNAQYGWTVNVQNDLGWHWKIHFQNAKWKFKSDKPSTLTLKVCSKSQFMCNNCDLIIVFSQNNAKYFRMIMQLNNTAATQK